MNSERLRLAERAVEGLPRGFPGPGGAAAVVFRGEILARYAWGWADVENRHRFTTTTPVHMCSVTKQFVCGVLLKEFSDISALDRDVRGYLPGLQGRIPQVRELCHNQSGLRDYWALTVLLGASPDAACPEADGMRLIRSATSTHFEPGTRYSYANQNFRILANIVQERTGRAFGELLGRQIFERAGMTTATFVTDTSTPIGCTGYEGAGTTGYRVAQNQIVWFGDAGLVASLDDMIAWERYADAERSNPGFAGNLVSAPVTFSNGSAAYYGYGLNRWTLWGRTVVYHSGGLRGWSTQRVHVPSERLSVVTLFNHNTNSWNAALSILRGYFDMTPASDRPAVAPLPCPSSFIEPETGVSVILDDLTSAGTVRLRFGGTEQTLTRTADGAAAITGMRLTAQGDDFRIQSPREGITSLLQPCYNRAIQTFGGLFRCVELGSEVLIDTDGSGMYACFAGFMGKGRMEALEPLGLDIWLMQCPRALDHAPPGNWTIQVLRDSSGNICGLMVGCWLARRLYYKKVQ